MCAGDAVIHGVVDFSLSYWFQIKLLCNVNIGNLEIYNKCGRFYYPASEIKYKLCTEVLNSS